MSKGASQKGIQLGRQEGRQEGIQLGEQKGRQESARSIARQLITNGVDRSIVKLSTGLSDHDLMSREFFYAKFSQPTVPEKDWGKGMFCAL
ncbi:hypothetical protein [Candidatus Sodalis sp. SoCistrobi]|uniref:hypothetical protein n=1 Tax=Candidatus Sodalis sp. SoCistrobi TaxID=1922216 RepID=UPI001C270080|nr:hypothetical protein [Candidatus Sodalis sp. SoCistrobi]